MPTHRFSGRGTPLSEPLAMVRGDDQECFVLDALGLQVSYQLSQGVVYLPNCPIVTGEVCTGRSHPVSVEAVQNCALVTNLPSETIRPPVIL